jgi:hypothetical protein
MVVYWTIVVIYQEIMCNTRAIVVLWYSENLYQYVWITEPGLHHHQHVCLSLISLLDHVIKYKLYFPLSPLELHFTIFYNYTISFLYRSSVNITLFSFFVGLTLNSYCIIVRVSIDLIKKFFDTLFLHFVILTNYMYISLKIYVFHLKFREKLHRKAFFII